MSWLVVLRCSGDANILINPLLKDRIMKRYQITLVDGLKPCLAALMIFSLTACVSTAEFDAMVKQRDMVLEEKASLQDKHNILQKNNEKLSAMLDAVEQQRQEAAEQAAEAEAELASQQNVYMKLQETFSKEQQANQVKIEMLKSGIKVNLANEILFPPGSSRLNSQGVEVLKRAAAELKESPYQTLVAGFTDNVAISGNLKKKYPSNWELAGARAARVVRLLEAEGVPSEQLIMLSLGENQPVESNDTPEGRSKNRRIEIILRPVPVTLD
jgi:chemotaxis protein MotB